MWMSDGRDCAGDLRQSLRVEDVDGKQDSLSYYIERIEVCILPEVCRKSMTEVKGIKLVGVSNLLDAMNYLK